jgi:hypothetical protein
MVNGERASGARPGGCARTSEDEQVVEVAVATYGVLASFVLSGAERNKREGRPNPPMVEYTAFGLCAVSTAAAIGLPAWALGAYLGVI